MKDEVDKLKTAIVATGSELTSGLVQDSNSKFLAESLTELAFDIKNIYICNDRKEDIKDTVLTAVKRADLIFITGGLGPTEDDITKEAFAEALNLKLNYSKEIENQLKNIFCNHESNMTDNNLSQAYIPEGGEVIDNKKGTAPALKVKNNNKLFYLLPGVPSELKYLFNKKIVNDLKNLNHNSSLIKEFNFIGIGESTLASQIDKLELDSNLKISYQAGKAEVKLRLKINSNRLKRDRKEEIINEAARKIHKYFEEYLYGEGQQNILDKLHLLLKNKKLTISTAESFTGGLIAQRLTQKPGSSEYFWGSIVAYNKKIKQKLLNIEERFLDDYGIVSKECAAKMAENVGVNTVAISEQIKHYTEAARLFIKGGDFERAEKAMKKAIAESNSQQKEKIYSDVKELYIQQGEIYEKKKKIKDAVKVYEKILEMNLSAEERDIYKNKLLNLYEKLGDVKKYFIMKGKNRE